MPRERGWDVWYVVRVESIPASDPVEARRVPINITSDVGEVRSVEPVGVGAFKEDGDLIWATGMTWIDMKERGED